MRNIAGIKCDVCGYRVGIYSPYQAYQKADGTYIAVFRHAVCRYKRRIEIAKT